MGNGPLAEKEGEGWREGSGRWRKKQLGEFDVISRALLRYTDHLKRDQPVGGCFSGLFRHPVRGGESGRLRQGRRVEGLQGKDQWAMESLLGKEGREVTRGVTDGAGHNGSHWSQGAGGHAAECCPDSKR